MGNSQLEISLLGAPKVTRNGADVQVDTRKAIALLAYLAIERAAPRDTLATLFWAESSPERSRATLRRTLSSLRSGVGPDVIAADRNRVELSSRTSSDIDVFEDEIRATESHEHDPSDVCRQCIPHLRRADSLYRGDFLEAFSIRDAPDFEDWSRSVAESMRLRQGEVLNRLAIAYASEGDYGAAIVSVARWIELDELHEPAHRVSMLLHAWAGDRPGAIQAYRNCVATLDRELGVAPLEETTELYEAILDEDLPPAPGARRRVQSHPSSTRPGSSEMLDRDHAVTVLSDALNSIETGGRLALITGESWMGKTRLIEHLLQEARDREIVVAPARAYRTEQKLPYGVATQLLDALSPAIQNLPDEIPDWMLLEAARLDPRLAPGRSASRFGRFGQLRFLEAIHGLLTLVATAKPLVVTIDDAQWVDSASAALIAYVARRVSDARILVVLSARAGEPLDPALEEAAVKADYQLVLDPLRPSDLRGLLDESIIESIIDATGGVPLLLQEAMESDTGMGESSNVHRYMESHLRGVSDLGRQVLAAASVLSGMCDETLLRETSGRTEDEIVEAVEELVSAGLLKEQEDGRLSFTLDALEKLVYDQTSLIRRRLLHRRAGEALEARPRAQSEARLATAIAAHLRDAGSREAAAWYRLAGDLAREVYANLEAEESYETAIALGIRDVGEVRLALGELAMARGNYDRAMRELRAAASQSSGPTLALVEHRMGDLQRILGRFDLADESFVRAEADHPSPADLYTDWALLRHRTGREEEAISFAQRALTVSAEPDEPGLHARSLNILGLVTPDRSEALVHLDQALSLDHDDGPVRMAALNNKAHLIAETGAIEDAMALVEEAIAIAEKTGLRHHRAALLHHLADLNHQAGRRAEAEEALTEAVTTFADVDAGEWEPEIWLLRQW